ncbi:MAG: NAD(P)/FAD-dependent oxidoreductase [Gemmatimonadota bacterium]|jgi:2-polyprenyl-6-methoxyphenol hydroxylase-like FAD-dependent oxidoreductase
MSEFRPHPEAGSAASRRLHILIVGGGVAGLTLAALLRQQGLEPMIVERSDEEGEASGYMLGLYYLGARVLHGLGLFEAYADLSVPMRRYEIRNGRGHLVHGYDLEEMARRVGPLRGISRTSLIRLLEEALGDLTVRRGITVEMLRQDAGGVVVQLSDGTQHTFDAVVGADGLHSSTRSSILAAGEYDYWDTDWAGWVSWVDPSLAPADTYVECWGAGRFVGLYPAKERLGVFLGGPATMLEGGRSIDFAARVSADLDDAEAGAVAGALESLQPSGDEFFWKLHDCRCKRWRNGRVALLGDAATGFLPTAGIGASMAMEGAAVLADELSRCDARWVEHSLDLYEERHRSRAESAQQSSRDLGRLMFVESSPLAWGRDQLVKHYSLERLVQSIATMMDEPI